MAFANDGLFQEPSIDFGTPRRPAGRYSDGMPVPGLYGSPPGGGMGLYGVGMGASMHTNADLPAKVTEGKAVDAGISRVIASLNQAVATYTSILTGTAQEGVLYGGKDAIGALQQVQQDLQTAIGGASQNYGSYQGSTDAWNTLDAAITKAKQAVATYDPVAAAVVKAGQQAQASRVAGERSATEAAASARAQEYQAQQAALQQQQRDQAAVNTAITRATTFAGQRNYPAALAALQAADVVAAATRIGRASDLETAVAAVAGQQSQVDDNARRLQEQQAACSQQGGTWNGSYCDFSARDTSRSQAALDAANQKVDTVLAQAAAQASTGGYRAALMLLAGVMADANKVGRGAEVQILQADVQQQQQDAARAAADAKAAAERDAQRAKVSARVDAAINQANAYAANGGYDVALSVLNGVMSAAVDAGRSDEVIAAQTAIQQARAAATTGSTSGGKGPTNAELLAFQRECLSKGGLWDGQNCDLSEARAREQSQREREDAQRAERMKEDRLMGLLSNPLFMSNPAVQQQVLAQILAAYGIDPGAAAAQQGGGMAQGVPGQAPQGGGMIANTGQYAGPFGEERF